MQYNVIHPRKATFTQKLPILLLYRPTKWRDTTYNKRNALPLHSLMVSLIESQILFYNGTIQYILQFFCFIGELPWENTTGHPIPCTHKLLANKYPKKNSFGGQWPTGPRTPMIGWVYSKTGVQTWVNNNIFESIRSRSITTMILLMFF